MSQGRRQAGDVYVVGESLIANTTAVDATTSGGVTIISVNTSGAREFAVTNSGSVNIFVQASYNGVFFIPSVAMARVAGNGGAGSQSSTVECVSASTMCYFTGPYAAVRVVANSGSGVYRAALTYR
jgi:hypothetical protein